MIYSCFSSSLRSARLACLSLLSLVILPVAAQFVPLQQPPATVTVPGNVVLALSVEFPTGIQISYTTSTYTFNAAVTGRYEGYFDNRKCYDYNTATELFSPVSALSATGGCSSSASWSGDVLNWLTMSNLDQFRAVMTGGTRDTFSSMSSATYPGLEGDTTGRTILIRSLTDRNSNTALKTLPAAALGVPTAMEGTRVRSGGYGSKFIASPTSNFGDLNAAQQRMNCATTPLGADRTCFNVRVEACVAVTGVGLEASCKNLYLPGVAKPEGLVQQYAQKMRFAAFGYLNESSNNRNGGVLRSAMKSVGPVATTATTTTANAAKEWNEITGIMVNNPDPTDAAASGVASSGLMNYLNKFGYAAGYKSFDPVGELYYAAQLYLRGAVPPSDYADLSGATAAQAAVYKDDFPVITGANLTVGGSRDPVISSCQKNFILGIGDKNTHCDGNLPGSTIAGSDVPKCSTNMPADPASLNVDNLWNTVDAMQGYQGGSFGLGPGSSKPYMAGLAHWGNTNDIRPDLPGKQTIRNYWVDVLEGNNGQSTLLGASRVKTQYWYTAKYGGFDTDVAGGNNPNTAIASWDADGNGVPDTWFAGSTPSLLKQGLSTAFSAIANASTATSAGSASSSSFRQVAGGRSFYTSYSPKDWTGSVSSCLFTQSAAECDVSPVWEASRWFKNTLPYLVSTPLTPTTRKIITSQAGSPFSKGAFQWADLNAAQKATLNMTDTRGQERVNYLRGDRTDEGVNFRVRRDTLLGDIVNSGVTYVAGSGPILKGPNYAGHAAYRLSNKNRPAVVYAGANDGMLHAFDATATATGGKELFGYIPGSVFGNLPGLTSLAFIHNYFVDSTPFFGDFQDGVTWKTMLTGGLGAGGKGFYGLNITDQASFSSATEASLGSLPMWEFTVAQDADIGFTFNEPVQDSASGIYSQIAKVADTSSATGVWRVIVGNGYGSTAGKSVLFMLDAATGVPAAKLVAAAGPLNGLSTPTPVDTDLDGLTDTIYAGDLSGKVHKFQFSKVSGVNFVLANSGDPTAQWRYLGFVFNSGQPITMAPAVTTSCTGDLPVVTFGTGKLNEDGDYADTSARGFFAVTDSKPSSALTVTLAELSPIAFTSNVVDTKNTRTWNAPNLAGKLGWYFTFVGGERVLSNSTFPPNTGTVLFGTTKPVGGACNAGNIGQIMAANLCTGKIGNLVVGATLVGGVSIDNMGGGILKIGNSIAKPGGRQGVVCNQSECKGPGGGFDLLENTAPRGRYSWREILSK